MLSETYFLKYYADYLYTISFWLAFICSRSTVENTYVTKPSSLLFLTYLKHSLRIEIRYQILNIYMYNRLRTFAKATYS